MQFRSLRVKRRHARHWTPEKVLIIGVLAHDRAYGGAAETLLPDDDASCAGIVDPAMA